MTSARTEPPVQHPDPVTRRVNTVTRDGAEVRVLVVRRTLAASPDEVWSALTEADRIERWLLPVSGDPAAGGRFRLAGGADGEVLACDRPERLSLTWSHDGAAGWVDASLRPVADGTLLQLDHTAPLTAARWAELGPGAAGLGWELALLALVAHLVAHLADPTATHPAVPAELGDLRGLCVGSTAAWADAAIADGDDPDAARAAAQRCLTSYVGS